MTDAFGDYDDDDALDTAVADPEQVARKLHALRRENDLESDTWDSLDDAQRIIRVAVIFRLLQWLRRQGAMR